MSQRGSRNAASHGTHLPGGCARLQHRDRSRTATPCRSQLSEAHRSLSSVNAKPLSPRSVWLNSLTLSIERHRNAANPVAREDGVTKTRYHRDMTTVRITEAELARDVHAVLEKVQQGSEVIIEREDHRPVALPGLVLDSSAVIGAEHNNRHCKKIPGLTVVLIRR